MKPAPDRSAAAADRLQRSRCKHIGPACVRMPFRPDPAAIAAAARDDVLGQSMKLRQTTPVIPILPYHAYSNSTRRAGETASGPATAPLWMNEAARASERADAPEDQPTLLIKAQGAEDLLCIPNALPLGKNRPPQPIPERLGREMK